jgi:hypothetical protein
MPSVFIVPKPTNPNSFFAGPSMPEAREPKSTYHSMGCGDPISVWSFADDGTAEPGPVVPAVTM